MIVRPGIYEHFNGGLYEVIGTALHSETLEAMVVYRARFGRRGLWVRPHKMFTETVNGRPRFQRVEDN